MLERLSEEQVELTYTPVINFAMQQNRIPTVRSLVINNTSNEDLANVEIAIASEPDFAFLWQKKIDLIPGQQQIDIGVIDLRIATKFLSGLTERIEGHLMLVIKSNEAVIYKQTYSISLLAYDEWPGIGIVPEMLAAFVTPNHPEVPKIIRRAASILNNWTGNPSFDEYQTRNPDRVKKQMAAIFEAISEKQIIYSSVPASFEDSGQRVRTADAIMGQQLGNCLDLSLLYAACLESVGIHPLLVVIKGHAFTGGWLIKETFADSVSDDPSLLSKRIADGINEITLVEATIMNAGNKGSFDDAIRSANSHLIKEDAFHLFADIKRCRFSGIRPLPLRVHTATGWYIVEDTSIERSSDVPVNIITTPNTVSYEQVQVSKQRLWERKLLDLSLRNNLLNLRISKSTLQFIAADLNKFEDGLASGSEFQILPKPADWDNPLRDAGVYRSINQSDPVIDLVKHELAQKRLRSYLTENELSKSITDLYRSAKVSLEENGANTLYIALGLLKWYETNTSERARYAPILLLPVEIVRRSAQKGYVIRSREEDTMMNITLLEMLRQDFGINIGGMENLPKDDNGVDVKLIFNTIRHAIMSKSRWDVEEQSFLGTFSFSKFIMWNDIHSNADKLSKNKIVASLISGKIEWQLKEAMNNRALDSSYHPSAIALPISADSSQLEAICAANEGNSFILHGPPGTGKSQTITNIIANALYQGKKVLFVAEKMAALSVVQKRLEAIGLSPFCLELHSNKSKKSAILDQLKKTTEIVKRTAPEDLALEAERLHQLRTELNDHVDALHRTYPFGLSLYDVFNRHARVADAPGHISFSAEAIAALTKERMRSWQDAAEELQSAGSICKHPYNHPLQYLHPQQYTQTLKSEAKDHILSYINALTDTQQKLNAVVKAFNIKSTLAKAKQLKTLNQLCKLMAGLSNTPASIFCSDTIEQIAQQIQTISDHGKQRNTFKAALLQGYKDAVLSIDADAILKEWQAASQKWFLPRLLKQNGIVKSMKGLSAGSTIDKQNIVEVLERTIAYQREQKVINDNSTFLSTTLGFLWQADDCNWEDVISICDGVVAINKELALLIKTNSEIKEWRSAMADNMPQGTKAYVADTPSIHAYIRSYNRLNEAESALTEKLGVDHAEINILESGYIENSLQFAQKWYDNIESLRDWTTWLQVRDKAIKAGLTPVVDAYETGKINSNEVISSFEKGLYRSCAMHIFNSEPVLSSFNGHLFEEKIEKFRKISNRFEQLTKEELYARLASKVPVFAQEASQSSEIGIMQRAIRNGGRGLSIRKLFDSIPNLLSRMCPCMLMSPISIAQYFDAGNTHFDLVVFDEASQMPTCEAVGAIARGTNVIVVGDPKQMPPTSFFSSHNVDEDNLDKEDLESILDDCLALSMPSNHLLWHYRSKHESLIAFSNSKYYENKLLTFPSPDDLATKVSYIPVKGYYDKSKTRQNVFEARAIADEIVQRLSDPELCKRSMGVVTFSSVQQILIDDMLTEVLRTRPDLEIKIAESTEPIFIKNLENVQGDERDVILFSVGYGPDADGKLSLNFGPLNRNGGWRRLNVAVSRARYEMKVFSTLRADQIDLNRTASEGVAGLKAFLEYAEKGKAFLQHRNPETVIPTAAFIQLVAREIEKHGYSVHTNIGCSGYRIDVGIVNPEKPLEYILGVLCDGEHYKAAKTAKDREIVQVDVLKLLDWNICKIWSTEWWEDPANVMQHILAAIKTAQQKPVKAEQPAISPVEVSELSAMVKEVLNASAGIVQPDTDINKNIQEYEVCLIDIVRTTSSDDFLLPHNQQRICGQISRVIEVEAPISKDLLCKRVLSAWGISRAGTRITAQFDMLFNRLKLPQTSIGGKTIFWRADQDAGSYTAYRVHKNELHKRDADDLPAEEIANLVKEILTAQLSLPKTELIRASAKVFGFARIGNNVELSMNHGIATAIRKGYAKEHDGRIILNEELN